MSKQKQKQQVTYVDSYEPNYRGRCENCGESPTVTAVANGKTVCDTGMCGPCTFGEAACIDPKVWNE